MDNATQIMERNWQVYHQQQKVTALTGSHLAAYYLYHDLSPSRFSPGTKILEVGIGLGHAVREMEAHGCEVHVMDICQRAIETVQNVVARSYLHRDAHQLPSDYFDVIMHHLVTQHMSEADLRWQLPHVIRSLKASGKLHIQWAGSDVPGENDLRESIVGEEGLPDVQNTPSMMGGRMCRSEEHAIELIEHAGGRVVRVTDRRKWPQYASSWFSMEVERC